MLLCKPGGCWCWRWCNLRQFFSLWYWGKSMMKNQQLYAEKSAYICWDFSRSFRPKTPPTTPFALFWYIYFAGPKRKLTLSYKVFFCFLQVLLHLWDRDFFGKIIWAFLGEDNHLWFWSNTSQNLWKIYAMKFNFLRPLYFDCFSMVLKPLDHHNWIFFEGPTIVFWNF